MKNLEAIRKDHLRRMAEPDDLRELRKQAERIRAGRALQAREFFNKAERDRLRKEIIDGGETPCR